MSIERTVIHRYCLACRAVAALSMLCLLAVPAGADTRPPAVAQVLQPPARTPAIGVRGFAELGQMYFSASDSFRAVFGESTGPIYGGGAEVRIRNRWFFQIGVERVRKTGQRVFVFNGQVFPLGIDVTTTITPVLVTGGYRFRGRRLTPYVGAGAGWYSYRETSGFAGAEDDVDDRFTGYHALGGVEFRILRWVSAAAELQYASVPDALGGGVAAEFRETDLGGTTVRLTVLVGR
jgi:opacity protein-like surface antigen